MQSNDLPWNLYVQHIPALLFIPAYSKSNKLPSQPPIESIFYDYENELDSKNLLKFILANSQNPNTIKDFLVSNFLNKSSQNENSLSKNSKLRYDLINLLTNKLKKLETKITKVQNKIIYLYENLNKTNIDHLKAISDDNDNNNFESGYLFEKNYDQVYFKKLHNLLNIQLNRYLNQIGLLNQFKSLFNKKN